MRYVRIATRILLGLVFIFSGFVKGVDPVGSAIKFGEYFEKFHISWLGSMALPFSILLSAAEFLIGVALVAGLCRKLTAWSALLFMSFFTVLTFYSALANPVSDCGCFGDAVKLTNWETFYKNLVLITFAIFVFISRDKYKPFSNPLVEWLLVGCFAAFGVGISIYSYRHLPIFDFRPYKVGTHIPSQMIIPEGAAQPVYKTTLVYEKNGVSKEFTMENYPWQDTTWKFKTQNSVVVSEGYIPPIHDFSITTKLGEELTTKVLTDTSTSLIFVVYDIEKANTAALARMSEYSKFAADNNMKFYALTGSTPEIAEKVKLANKLSYDFDFMDQTALKTIVRSNPGLMVLRGGVVLGLWHYNDFPTTSYFKGNVLSTLLTAYHRDIEWKRSIILGLGLLLVLVAMFYSKND